MSRVFPICRLSTLAIETWWSSTISCRKRTSRPVTKLFTKKSHHCNTSVIYLVQNVFPKGKESRTISLNVCVDDICQELYAMSTLLTRCVRVCIHTYIHICFRVCSCIFLITIKMSTRFCEFSMFYSQTQYNNVYAILVSHPRGSDIIRILVNLNY